MTKLAWNSSPAGLTSPSCNTVRVSRSGCCGHQNPTRPARATNSPSSCRIRLKLRRAKLPEHPGSPGVDRHTDRLQVRGRPADRQPVGAAQVGQREFADVIVHPAARLAYVGYVHSDPRPVRFTDTEHVSFDRAEDVFIGNPPLFGHFTACPSVTRERMLKLERQLRGRKPEQFLRWQLTGDVMQDRKSVV